MNVIVSKVKVRNLKNSISKAVELLGGFKKFVKPNEEVLLKPNYVFNLPYPATTSPDFLKAVIELLQENGINKIVVGESAVMYRNTRKIFQSLGILDVLESLNVELVLFDEDEYHEVVTKGKYWKEVSFAKKVFDADKIIYLPCLKTHRLADFTISLKLTDGFVRQRERWFQHAGHLREKMVDLNTVVKPALIIVDARKIFINEGPGEGERAKPNIIMASTDRIAIDVEGIKVIQKFPNNSLDMNAWDYPQIKYAVSLGIDDVRNENDYKVVEA